MNKVALRLNQVCGQLRRIYFMALPEKEEDYKNSRRFYVVGECASQTIGQLAGGSFLVALLLYMGFTDAQTGVLTSLSGLAAVSQVFVLSRVNRLKKRKLFVCVMTLLKIGLAFAFFIPLMRGSLILKQILVVLLYFLSQIFIQVGSPATSDWIADLVPVRTRGHFLAKKDAVAVFVTVVSCLIGGFVMDAFPGPAQTTGFLINGSAIFLLTLLHFWAMSCMKEPRVSWLNEDGKEIHGKLARRYPHPEEEARRDSFLRETVNAFREKHFRIAFAITMLWQISYFIGVSFNTSYQLKELGLSFTFLMVSSFLCNLVRVALTPSMGRLGDRYGITFIYKYSVAGIMLYFVFMALAVPSNARLMVILSSIVSCLEWTFAGTGLFAVQLEFVNEKKRTAQFTILSSTSGIAAFVVTYLSGLLLDFFQLHPLRLFGVTLYAQQITNTLSVISYILMLLYLKFRVQPIEKALSRR